VTARAGAASESLSEADGDDDPSLSEAGEDCVGVSLAKGEGEAIMSSILECETEDERRIVSGLWKNYLGVVDYALITYSLQK
jgi:hypothetical protein